MTERFLCTACGVIEGMDALAPICHYCGSDKHLVSDEAWCKWVIA